MVSVLIQPLSCFEHMEYGADLNECRHSQNYLLVAACQTCPAHPATCCTQEKASAEGSDTVGFLFLYPMMVSGQSLSLWMEMGLGTELRKSTSPLPPSALWPLLHWNKSMCSWVTHTSPFQKEEKETVVVYRRRRWLLTEVFGIIMERQWVGW